MALVVCLAGKIGSGKSSVSRGLADLLGWPRVGFGDFLRSELQRRGGDPLSREALQELGQSLVDSDLEGFCRAVLSSCQFEAGGNLLIDGIRHVLIYRKLSEIVRPSLVRLIFLSADEERRLDRIEKRDDDGADFSRANNHRVEADLRNALPMIADATVDARQDLSEVVRQTLAAIHNWQWSA